jgi:hypothetical protein
MASAINAMHMKRNQLVEKGDFYHFGAKWKL